MAAVPVDALLVTIVRDDQDKPMALRVDTYKSGGPPVKTMDVLWAEEESWMTAWLVAGRALWAKHGRLLR